MTSVRIRRRKQLTDVHDDILSESFRMFVMIPISMRTDYEKEIIEDYLNEQVSRRQLSDAEELYLKDIVEITGKEVNIKH